MVSLRARNVESVFLTTNSLPYPTQYGHTEVSGLGTGLLISQSNIYLRRDFEGCPTPRRVPPLTSSLPPTLPYSGSRPPLLIPMLILSSCIVRRRRSSSCRASSSSRLPCVVLRDAIEVVAGELDPVEECRMVGTTTLELKN
jgi:hypothetical protein